MKRKLLTVAISAVVMGMGAAQLHAATIGPITTSTPISSSATDWVGSLAFPQFNPSLGALQSVEIVLGSSLTTTLTVTNTDDTLGSAGTAKTELEVTVQDGGLHLNAPELDLLSPIYSYSLGAGASSSSGLLSKTGSDDETYTLPAILSEFTGGGSITLPASTFTQTDLSNTGGNTNASQVTDASLTGTVTYTYTPVPEPTSLALIGLGSLALLRRRRA